MIEVQEFRAEVRQWLADNLVGEFAALKGLGGPGREHEAFEERRAWNQHLAAAGLTCLGWPEEHGGRGLTVAHRVAFYEEYAMADAPDKVNHFGEELLGPTLIAYGTPEQQQRFLPKILDVTELWCQGYSEPGAGSDLANVSTTAELDGDAVGHQRPEGVDVAGALGAVVLRRRPHREGLQAARRPVLPAGAAGSAGRRDPADRPADRRLGVQRGVLRRRPHRRRSWWSVSPATAGGSRWAR